MAGHIPKDEIKRWRDEFIEVADQLDTEFGVFVDMRNMELLPPESRPYVLEVQRYAYAHGTTRSVVILKDKITKMQFKGIAKETGIYEWERYIDAEAEPNWEQIGLDWIIHAIDPDKKLCDTAPSGPKAAT